MAQSGFFSVGRDTFLRACDLGINPAAAFLVLARDSGSNNVTTHWSADAASKRLGTRWATANRAIATLTDAGLAIGTRGSTRPAYKLVQAGDPLWLPNAVVDGAAGEAPPAARIRQTQDPMTLRLFVELYGEQNLREDGGIAPALTWHLYEREPVGQMGQYVVWRFHGGVQRMRWGSKATDGQRRRLTASERKAGQHEADDFFARFGQLRSLGLVEWVPHLFDGPDGEPIHPLNWDSSTPLEEELYAASRDAARRCLTSAQRRACAKAGGVLAVVPRHIAQVQLLGIFRLRYRPHTRLTGAWWIEHEARCREYIAGYDRIAAEDQNDDSAAGAA